jgi:hypothetical protein
VSKLTANGGIVLYNPTESYMNADQLFEASVRERLAGKPFVVGAEVVSTDGSGLIVQNHANDVFASAWGLVPGYNFARGVFPSQTADAVFLRISTFPGGSAAIKRVWMIEGDMPRIPDPEDAATALARCLWFRQRLHTWDWFPGYREGAVAYARICDTPMRANPAAVNLGGAPWSDLLVRFPDGTHAPATGAPTCGSGPSGVVMTVPIGDADGPYSCPAIVRLQSSYFYVVLDANL